jgi:hypothetical protein
MKGQPIEDCSNMAPVPPIDGPKKKASAKTTSERQDISGYSLRLIQARLTADLVRVGVNLDEGWTIVNC